MVAAGGADKAAETKRMGRLLRIMALVTASVTVFSLY